MKNGRTQAAGKGASGIREQIFVHHRDDQARAVERVGGQLLRQRLIDRHGAASAGAAKNIAAPGAVGRAYAGGDTGCQMLAQSLRRFVNMRLHVGSDLLDWMSVGRGPPPPPWGQRPMYLS